VDPQEITEELQRITTANGPAKVVFSPDGTLAYVNHLRARVVEVIRVADRRIVKTIHGTAPESSDEVRLFRRGA
jgi:hypothetical protein